MGPLGWQETVVILIVALVVFGPRKLPELGKTLGKAMTEFRRASSELRTTWKREMDAFERESQSIKRTTREISNEISSTLRAHVDNPEDPYEYEQEHGRPPSKPTGSAAKQPTQQGDQKPQTTATPPNGNAKSAPAPEGTVPAGTQTTSEKNEGGGKPPQSEAVTS